MALHANSRTKWNLSHILNVWKNALFLFHVFSTVKIAADGMNIQSLVYIISIWSNLICVTFVLAVRQ